MHGRSVNLPNKCGPAGHRLVWSERAGGGLDHLLLHTHRRGVHGSPCTPFATTTTTPTLTAASCCDSDGTLTALYPPVPAHVREVLSERLRGVVRELLSTTTGREWGSSSSDLTAVVDRAASLSQAHVSVDADLQVRVCTPSFRFRRTAPRCAFSLLCFALLCFALLCFALLSFFLGGSGTNAANACVWCLFLGAWDAPVRVCWNPASREQCEAALVLAQHTKAPPRATATRIVEAASTLTEGLPIDSVTVSGPGTSRRLQCDFPSMVFRLAFVCFLSPPSIRPPARLCTT